MTSYVIHGPAVSTVQQRDFLAHLHQTLNDPSHPIRNRLLRLLAVFKQEGKI